MFITKYWYQTCVRARFDSRLRRQFYYIWCSHRHSWWRTGSEGRGQSRWWLSMRFWLGRKGDRYLDQKDLSYGCIQNFILFSVCKNSSRLRKDFEGSRRLDKNIGQTLMILTRFDRLDVKIMELIWAQSVYYLNVDEVLAVLDGVDISLEDWVLTGPSRPTISRAQNLEWKIYIYVMENKKQTQLI